MQMKLHLIEGYVQTIYIAEYPDRLLLLDGCSRPDVETIVNFITKDLKRPLTDLKMVIVTHMHPDHSGAATILRKLCGCKVAGSNTPGHWYQGISGYIMYKTDLWLTQWMAKRKKKPKKNMSYPRKIKYDLLLDDGEYLPGFFEWQVFQTPGHTDRDLCLYHVPTDRLYLADLIVVVKERYIPPFPVFFPDKYKESLDKLFSLKPKSVFLAHHGEVFLTLEDVEHLKAKTPPEPVTLWRSVNGKLLRTFFKKPLKHTKEDYEEEARQQQAKAKKKGK
ncbi:MAG: MBL fold metallo-hydrolase [Enterovibrio sp.]